MNFPTKFHPDLNEREWPPLDDEISSTYIRREMSYGRQKPEGGADRILLPLGECDGRIH